MVRAIGVGGALLILLGVFLMVWGYYLVLA